MKIPAPAPALALADGLAMVFDMDGVLVNSNPWHTRAWMAFTRRHGLQPAEEAVRLLQGKRNDEIIRELFGPGLSQAEIERRGAQKEALYRELIGPRLSEALVPGIIPFLETYRQAPLALASNAERNNVDFLLDRAGLRQFFRVTLDCGQVERPKPHPDIYLRAAGLLNRAPENVIVFEDSPFGVEAARQAGMRVIGVSTTYVNLPGTALTIDNFLSGELYPWLATQRCAA